MTKQERREALREWVDSRPECVKRLIARFPLYSLYEVEGERQMVVGYSEPDRVILWPEDGAGHAIENGRKKYVHSDCLEKITPIRVGG